MVNLGWLSQLPNQKLGMVVATPSCVNYYEPHHRIGTSVGWRHLSPGYWQWFTLFPSQSWQNRLATRCFGWCERINHHR